MKMNFFLKAVYWIYYPKLLSMSTPKNEKNKHFHDAVSIQFKQFKWIQYLLDDKEYEYAVKSLSQ